MTIKLKETDAVVIGMGFSGAILSRELTKAGLNVVGLERGADRNPAEEFTLTRLRDELRYVVRLELMQDNSTDTITSATRPTSTRCRSGDSVRSCPAKASAAPAFTGARCTGASYRPISASRARCRRNTAPRPFRIR